jgi:ferredoxin
VGLLHRRSPQEILRDAAGRARGVRTLDVARVFDEQGRFAPQTVPGTEREVACDTVILAIGQMADLSFLGPDHGLTLTPQGLVAVDRETLGTSRAGVFAGGDLAFGPRIVITAVADGRRAARSIDTHLTGRRDAPLEHHIQVFPSLGYDHPFAVGDYDQIERTALPVVEVAERTQRREVERVLDLAAAQAEGKRCLHCWINTVFDGSRLEGSECIQCGGCVDVCPEQCLDLASIVKIAGEQGPGAALLKDETRCIRCGLCARRCPVGCISMQAITRAREAPLMRLAEVAL